MPRVDIRTVFRVVNIGIRENRRLEIRNHLLAEAELGGGDRDRSLGVTF